jgi:GNAT superfamily N-acetyltransferase
MSGLAPIEAGAQASSGPRSESQPPTPGDAALAPGSARARAIWRVRAAVHEDAPAVAAAVGKLLVELGGTPPPVAAMQAAALALLDDREAGALLVADTGGGGLGVHIEAGIVEADTSKVEEAVVGVLGASWQSAIHAPGRYGLIQDLWVHPSWRGSGVGGGLLAALFELARERGVERLEVGLPRTSFGGLAATEAFYLASGFTTLGTRMRRILA